MKNLLILITIMLVGGCGKDKETPVKELTAEEKKALRDSVVGEYELKYKGNTSRQVFLENGIRELYANGKLASDPNKWSIVDGEIHLYKKIIGSQMMGNSLSLHETYLVWRINTDKSITDFAFIIGGKRTDFPKEAQKTYKKIK